MDDIKQLTTLAGGKMLPFFKTAIIYFPLMMYEETIGPFWSTIFKCAPIVCLMAFIYFHDFMENNKEHGYSQKICFGLFCSLIGDIFLNIDMFPHGMAAFGIAHLFYISAFGFKRISYWLGGLLYTLGFLILLFLQSNIKSTVLLYGLPIYATCLLTMCWRAIDRVLYKPTSSLTSLLCALGSILFIFSDTMIAIDKFYTPISGRLYLVMVTYYAAQFGFTVSTVNIIKNKPKAMM